MGAATDFLHWVQDILRTIGHGIVVRFREEPIITVGLFRAGLTVAVGFGLGWSGEQVALMVTFIEAVTAFISRREVTPLANPRLDIGTTINADSPHQPTGVVVNKP